MKKLYISLLCAAALLLSAAPASAQEDPNPTGTIMISADIGPVFDKNEYGNRYMGAAPFVAADYVVTDSIWKGHLSVGAALGSYFLSMPHARAKLSFTAFSLAPRVLYGINAYKFLEIHFGAEAGAALVRERTIYSEDYIRTSDPTMALVLGGILGVRYNFTGHLSANAEIRTSSYTPFLSLGVTYKF